MNVFVRAAQSLALCQAAPSDKGAVDVNENGLLRCCQSEPILDLHKCLAPLVAGFAQEGALAVLVVETQRFNRVHAHMEWAAQSF